MSLPEEQMDQEPMEDKSEEQTTPADVSGSQADPEPAAVSEQGTATESSSAKQETTEEGAWYVIHCYSGYENKVRHNLEQRIETMGMKDRIFDVVIPTQEEIEVKDGKRRTVERHIFPGYA